MTQKDTLLFIGPYPPPYSGPEMGMKLFLESSLKDEYQIIFLRTNVRKTNKNKGKIGPITIIAFFRFLASLIYRIIRYRPALAYYPVTATQLGWIGRDIWCLLICRFFGVKTVIHLRCGHLKLNFALFCPLAQWLVRKACAGVSAAIVQADCLKDQFDQLVPADRIERLYQAIDTDEYDNLDTASYVSGKIVFMGHMTKAKGYCDLVKVMEPVIAKCPQTEFYFAGTMRRGERSIFFNQTNGERLVYQDPVETEAEVLLSSVANHYHNLGVVSGKVKMRHLLEADLFVLPSYSEGFSRAMLEAMSMGKPVVYTPVGAHREVMQDGINGLEVRPGDQVRIAECICTLLEKKQLRNKIAVANHQRVRRDFDIRTVSRELSAIFRAVLDRGHSNK
jgi:glycosyltransferase involved in cell wall biosynthesis